MERKKILVIEDDTNIRDVLKLALEFEGYEVATAKDGKEGLDVLNKIPVQNLILLDLMMPIMNGWEFVDIFKKEKKFNTIPIVVVSAYSERAKNIECDAFVEKPLELDTLINTVKEYIQ